MTDAVIVSTARTPIGSANKGSLVDVDAFELGRLAIVEVLARSGIPAADVDDIVLGETLQGGGDIARYAAVEAGLSHVPGVALNRHCATGLSSVTSAAASIAAGMDRVVIAGGAHSSSTMAMSRRRTPGTDDWDDWMSPSHPDSADAPNRDMSITVGWSAARLGQVTREEMDGWAYQSHRRAVEAIDGGLFDEEIFPVEVQTRDGSTFSFAADEHPRRNTSMEKLASLKPLHPEIEGFSITAGNASGINDASAAVVVTAADYADKNALSVLAHVRAWASIGVPAEETGIAPTKVVPKALARAGLTIDDISLWEINEAFASVTVATNRILGIDPESVNVLGSGCSLGHPIAATGTRMVISLIHELRRRGGGFGVATMCAGGGMGGAVVLEVPPPS